MSKDNGGPAFGELQQVGDVAMRDGGISIRDYFAAKAIPSGLNVSSHDAANLVGRECPFDSAGKIQWIADVHSAICYIMADAMLKERAK